MCKERTRISVKRRINKRWLWTLLVLTLTLLGAVPAAAAEEQEQVVLQGVWLGEVEISGMTADEVEAEAEKQIERALQQGIQMQMNLHTVTINVQDLGLTVEKGDVVEEAMAYGRQGNLVRRYCQQQGLETEGYKLRLNYQVDEEKVKAAIEEKCVPYNEESVDSQLVRRSDGSFEIISGSAGSEIDVEASVQAVQEYIADTWNGLQDGAVELVINTVEDQADPEELGKVQDILGESSTEYAADAGARCKNVEAGVRKVSGTVLYPGEEFSMLEKVVPFDEENGYAKAAEYRGGKVVYDYGGGICQVSTTLYQAVLKAELEVTERYNHSMMVSYSDPGFDAAIAEGSKDFKFKNNTNAPIYIEGYTQNGVVGFRIYGQEYRDPSRTIRYYNEIISQTDPQTQLKADSEAAIGTITEENSPKTGYKAKLWKDITENGQTTTEQVNTSSYAVSNAVYLVGIKSTNTELVSKMRAAISDNSLNDVYTLKKQYGV